jgi:hypothetical protein
MKQGQNQASRRLNRLLRTKSFGAGVLLVGSAALLLGIGVLLSTIHYTPEQLDVILRSRPWTQDFFLLLPAPEHYRSIGAVASVAGLTLVAAGALIRSDEWWS